MMLYGIVYLLGVMVSILSVSKGGVFSETSQLTVVIPENMYTFPTVWKLQNVLTSPHLIQLFRTYTWYNRGNVK